MTETILPGRIVRLDENGKILAEIDFPLTEEGIHTITHTFVDPSLRGKGLAAELVEEVLALAKKEGFRLRATCPYAKVYFEKHPDPTYLPQ